MNVRLVLCSAPVSLQERYGSLAGAGSTEPSFGLVCLAAAARQAGAEVHIVEASSEGLSVERAAAEIRRHDPHIVGLSATTSGIVAAGSLADALKASGSQALILIGGCHATALPEQTLDEFRSLDQVVIGEGEATLAAIIKAVGEAHSLPPELIGTAERRDGRPHRNAPRPLIENLDELPLPAWSLLRGFPRAYHPSPARIRRWPCASVVLTRGCPNVCTFCDRSVFGRRCRSYSPAYAVRLIRDLHDHHGVKEILIEDDTFVIVKDHVREFCERLIAECVDVSWSCLGRADRADQDLLTLMKRAGCWHISYGIESGDPQILKSVHKNLNMEQVRLAIEWSRSAGLRTKGFFIVGFPGETHESLEATRRVALSLPLHDISVMRMTPFPGSELYETASTLGTLNRNWKQMNTLTSVFIPRGLSQADLDGAHVGLLRSFYRRPSVLWDQTLHALSHPRLLYHALKGLASLVRLFRSPS